MHFRSFFENYWDESHHASTCIFIFAKSIAAEKEKHVKRHMNNNIFPSPTSLKREICASEFMSVGRAKRHFGNKIFCRFFSSEWKEFMVPRQTFSSVFKWLLNSRKYKSRKEDSDVDIHSGSATCFLTFLLGAPTNNFMHARRKINWKIGKHLI